MANPPPRTAATTATVANVRNDAETTRRQSMIFFLNPNYDAIIECLPTCATPENPPKYRPIAAGELLAELLKATVVE